MYRCVFVARCCLANNWSSSYSTVQYIKKQIIDKKCDYLYIMYIFINIIIYIIRTNVHACDII